MDVKCSHVLPQQRVSANLRVCGTWTREIFQVLIQNLAMMCQMWCVSFSFSCIRTNTHSWIQLFHITFTFTHTQTWVIHVLIATTIPLLRSLRTVYVFVWVYWPLSLMQKASRCAASSVPFSVLTSTAFSTPPTTLHTVVLEINRQWRLWYPYCIKSSHMFTLSLIKTWHNTDLTIEEHFTMVSVGLCCYSFSL